MRLKHLLVANVILFSYPYSAWATPLDDLQEAVRKGNSAAVISAVEQGADPNAILNFDTGEYKIRTLPWAAKYGNLKLIQFLLDKGADINAVSPYDGHSAFTQAAASNQLTTLQFLASHKANLQHQLSDNGPNALTVSAEQGHTAVVQWLIEQGVAFINSETNSALHKALTNQHADVVALLLQAHPLLKISPTTLTAVLTQVSGQGSPQELKMMLTHLKALDNLKQSPYANQLLFAAFFGNNLPNLQWLLAQGIDPKQPYQGPEASWKGKTILGLLVRTEVYVDKTILRGQWQGPLMPLLDTLMAYQAPLTAVPFDYLCQMDSLYGGLTTAFVAKALTGTPLKTTNKHQQSLLHQSVAQWSPAVTTYLLQQGLDVNGVDQEGNTPLMLLLSTHEIMDNGPYDTIIQIAEADAARFERIWTVLLAHKPNVNVVNKKGDAILSLLMNNWSGTGYLPEKGMDGDVRNAALLKGFKQLLQNGAVLTVGKPPLKEKVLDIMIENRIADHDLLQTLLNKGAVINLKKTRISELYALALDDTPDNGPKIALMERLLQAKVPLNDGRESLPLVMAVEQNQPILLDWLLKKGANPSAIINDYQQSVAHQIVESYEPNAELLKVLLRYKPNLNLKDRGGVTPLALAESRGNDEFVQLLKAAGAKN